MSSRLSRSAFQDGSSWVMSLIKQSCRVGSGRIGSGFHRESNSEKKSLITFSAFQVSRSLSLLPATEPTSVFIISLLTYFGGSQEITSSDILLCGDSSKLFDYCLPKIFLVYLRVCIQTEAISLDQINRRKGALFLIHDYERARLE